MADFKHSMEEAVEVQRAFEKEFGADHNLLGVGIGLNEARDDLAITVLVEKQEAVAKLPTEFNGLDVVVSVVGANTAY